MAMKLAILVCNIFLISILIELSHNPVKVEASNNIIGLTGSQITQRSGENFTPQNKDQFFKIENGRIKYPDGSIFVGTGYNAIDALNGGLSGATFYELDERGFKIIRIYAADHNYPFVPTPAQIENCKGRYDIGPNPDISIKLCQRAQAVKDAVNRIYSYNKSQNGVSDKDKKFKVVIALSDYYNPLPGEKMVKDNPRWCSGFIYPWTWFRVAKDNSQKYFDFEDKCVAGNIVKDIPNFQVYYEPFVKETVRLLKDNPGVFAWQLGNEIRALGPDIWKDNKYYDYGEANDSSTHFANFSKYMINTIRSIDGNHLITPGAQNIFELSSGCQKGDGYCAFKEGIKNKDTNNPTGRWEKTFDLMLEVPYNFWSMTYYNHKEHMYYDVPEFKKYSIPNIATEFGFCKGYFSEDPIVAWTGIGWGSKTPTGPSVNDLLTVKGLDGIFAWEKNDYVCGYKDKNWTRNYRTWDMWRDLSNDIRSRKVGYYQDYLLPIPTPAITPTVSITPTPTPLPTVTLTPTPIPTPASTPNQSSTTNIAISARGASNDDFLPILRLKLKINGEIKDFGDQKIGNEKEYQFVVQVKKSDIQKIIFEFCNDTTESGLCDRKPGGKNRDISMNYILVDNAKYSFDNNKAKENTMIYNRSDKEDSKQIYDWGKLGVFGTYDDYDETKNIGPGVIKVGEQMWNGGPSFAGKQIYWTGWIILNL